MATKSKLEQAVEKRAAELDPAQREILLAQFATYKQNKRRQSELLDLLSAIGARPTATLDELRAKQADRAAASIEYNQVTTANSRLAADIFAMLGEGRD